MTDDDEHEPGCVLDPVFWLRHAIAATNRRVDGSEPESTDHLSSASLLNALEHFAEQDNWRTVTLLEVTQYASLMGGKFSHLCTCGRGGSGPHRAQSREW